MTLRFRVLPAFALLVLAQSPNLARAEPITYNFRGTADLRNIFASGYLARDVPFTGSITMNSVPSWTGPLSATGDDGSDVLLTITVEGHTLSFDNNSGNPQEFAKVSLTQLPPWQQSNGAPSYEFMAIGASGTEANGSTQWQSHFAMTFYSPGEIANISDMRDLNFTAASASLDFGEDWGFQQTAYGWQPTISWGGDGTITSMELVTTPEPSALLIFAMMAGTAWVHRCFRRS